MIKFLILFLPITLLAKSGDFLEDNWKPKDAPVFSSVRDTTLSDMIAINSVVINPKDTIIKISSAVFGNNANGYMGPKIVNDSTARKHLKNTNISYMRLPGGNWSNLWLWDHKKPANINAAYYSSTKSAPNVNWTLTTDTLYALADSIGAIIQPCVNYSISRYLSGPDSVEQAAAYAASWVADVKARGIYAPYWEVGNENYGSWQSGYIVNGDTITGYDYGRDFVIFSDSMKKANPNIKIGAVIYPDSSADKSGWFSWTKGVMTEAKESMDYLILHEYFTYANNMNDVTPEEVIASISKIAEDRAIIDAMVENYTGKAADNYPVMVSEYNLRAGYKEMSMLAPIFQTMAVNEFIKNRFGLVNLWDIANGYSDPTSSDGDHGMLTRKDPNRTDYEPNPAFFGYYFMTQFIGDAMITTSTLDETVKWYSSMFSNGEIGVIGVNSSKTTQAYSVNISDFKASSINWYILDADSITSSRVRINGVESSFTIGGPELYDTISPYKADVSNGFILTLPANSIIYGIVDGQDLTTVHDVSLPHSEQLSIKPISNGYYIQSPSIGTLNIISLSGRIVESYENFRNGTVGSNLTSGTYIISWSTSNLSIKRKIILK